MTVTRPLNVSGGGGGGGNPFANLSAKERAQLQEENGSARVGLANLGDPGEKFSTDNFVTQQLSFSERKERQIAELDGVATAAGGLTLNALHISGTVPEGGAQTPGGPPGGGAPGRRPARQHRHPEPHRQRRGPGGARPRRRSRRAR